MSRRCDPSCRAAGIHRSYEPRCQPPPITPTLQSSGSSEHALLVFLQHTCDVVRAITCMSECSFTIEFVSLSNALRTSSLDWRCVRTS